MAARDYKEGEEILRLVIPGRPTTKKTHQQIIYVKGRPRILPSPQYLAYEKLCKAACLAAWADEGNEPIDFGISILMKVFLPNYQGIGDHNGYMQAIGDILQKWNVIEDDMWIAWDSDGAHWLSIDPSNPRVEIIICRKRHPLEDCRTSKHFNEAA